MNYQLTEYSPKFKAQVAALRSRVFGGSDTFNTKYFEWKYEQNPYLKEPHFYIALHEGNVVGMQAMYGCQWRVGTSSISCTIPCGAEFAVDPDHQHRGLGSQLVDYKLQDMAKKGYKYVMELSLNPASRRIFTTFRYERVAKYHSFEHRGAITILARGHRRVKTLIGGRRSKVHFRQFDNWSARNSGSVYGTLEPRVSDMSELASRYCDESTTHHVRDTTFYQWRFMDPRSVYRFLFYGRGESPEGFFVLQQAASGGYTTIVDWETSTPGVWLELLDAAVESNVHPLKITSPTFSEEQTKALRCCGFDLVAEPDTSTNPASGMFIKILSNENTAERGFDFRRALASKNLEMRMICSDAF